MPSRARAVAQPDDPDVNGNSAERKAADVETDEHLLRQQQKWRVLDMMLSSFADFAYAFDREGRFLYANQPLLNLWGLTLEEAVGKNFFDLKYPDEIAARIQRQIQEVFTTGKQITDETEYKSPTGVPGYHEYILSGVIGISGTVELVAGATRDITARKGEQEHLVQMEARYRGLLEAAPDAMVVVDKDGGIVLLNVQAESQFGYSRDELIGQKVKSIIPEGFAERLIADGTRTAAEALAQQIGTGIELTGRRKDGSEFPIEIMLSPLESAEGVLVTAAVRNITVRKEAENHLGQMEGEARATAVQIVHAAEHDFLTGLPNRLLLNDRISQAIALAARNKDKVAVLFLDMDGFKHINDSLGHPVGDKLLQCVANRLRDCVRAPDTVSRQGGDEFIVLLQGVNRPEAAAVAAGRLLKSVAETCSMGEHDIHITTSIGISLYPDDGLDAETLIKNADTAMYQAKENGRQSYQFFKSEMNVRAVERQSIEEDLRHALKHKEFALHYQPKIDLATGAITGAEALLRWTHSSRGPVSPAQFIPIAEDSGLILPIGSWVLREACMQARAWTEAGLPIGTIAVNVSAIQLRNRDFLDELCSTLRLAGLDPRSLELEVTESALMKDSEIAAAVLQSIREMGVRIAIDDFGTGYSSLSYLRKFPLDALKIDQSFIRQINTSPGDTAIVNAIISMGQSLNLRVIAEGVETVEDLEFLQHHKCDEAQGYYFSRPVPAEQFAEMLKVERSMHTHSPKHSLRQADETREANGKTHSYL